MAGGMETEDYLGARGAFDAQALSADRHAAVGADLEGCAETPNIRPPRAARGGAQDGALFLLGEFPGLFRGHTQFAVGAEKPAGQVGQGKEGAPCREPNLSKSPLARRAGPAGGNFAAPAVMLVV